MRNVVENVRPDHLIVPYGHTGTDIEELERKTHVIWLPVRKGKYLKSIDYFCCEPESYTDAVDSPIQKAIDDAAGVQRALTDNNKPAKVYEQHRWLDLDKDGIEEPYIVTVDAQSRRSLV